MKAFLAGLILWMTATAGAWAHAFLERAEPAVGATVKASPTEVRLSFSEKLEPKFSSIKVLDATGKQVDKNDLRAEPGNAAILHVSLSALPPGTYKVVWRATSVDTHVTKGEFTFRTEGP